ERGMRSGTLATHQIAGMGEAFAIAAAEGEADQARITALRDRLLEGLGDLDGIHRNTAVELAVPNILNLAFAGVEGESLLMALRDIALSTGSACNSASVEPSYVLKGIGLPRSLALASLRFSFGRYTTEADIDRTLDALRHALGGLRRRAV
ncbi:aminotransferase class V-fold PLP-dependent enzyme, partial [Halomonas sp.]|uniref:aminotransferase class V-fold PLP-dependent enzyme n=1 Tax=Halomonas sp. TaxID=1486246 RepID=UPI00298E4A49